MRQPEIIYGQGESPYGYYRQAPAVIFPGADIEYVGLKSHMDVAKKLDDRTPTDILIADTALYGPIEDSQRAMPDVFEHPEIMSYAATILEVVFHKYRHADISPRSISRLILQKPVIGHCRENIKLLKERLGSDLPYAYVEDSGQAAEVLRKDGLYEGEPAYAICNQKAGEACGLVSDGVASDMIGATRFIAYNNEGERDLDGSHISIALRTGDNPHALLKAVESSFDGINMTSLVQLNTPEGVYADFAIEFARDKSNGLEPLHKLRDNDIKARILGQYTPVDTRLSKTIQGYFNYDLLATGTEGLVTICMDMSDETGGLVKNLRALNETDLHGIRISTMNKADMSKVLAIDIEPGLVQKVLDIVPGSVYVGNRNDKVE